MLKDRIIYIFKINIKDQAFNATVVLQKKEMDEFGIEYILEKFRQCERLLQDNIDFNLGMEKWIGK